MGEIRLNKAAFDAVANSASPRRELQALEARLGADGLDAGEQQAIAGLRDHSEIKISDGQRSAVIVSLPLDPGQTSTRALDAIAAHTTPGKLFGTHLDTRKLGASLAKSLSRDLAQAPVVAEVLAKTKDNHVINSLLAHTSDDRLKALAANPTGKALLRQAYTSLNAHFTTPEECRGMQRIMGAMSPLYGPLATFEFNPPPAFSEALKANGAKLQKLSEASNICNTRYDNYRATVKLSSPEQALEIFKSFAADLNNVGDRAFDAMENFTLRGGDGKSVLPEVGDIYDIDILGPDNGAVMVGSAEYSLKGGHFSIVTITESGGSGVHPENGVREFGFDNHQDGTYTFYTTGASRGLNSVIHTVGGLPQEVSAKGLIKGFVDHALKAGGEVVKPLSYEMKDPVLLPD